MARSKGDARIGCAKGIRQIAARAERILGCGTPAFRLRESRTLTHQAGGLLLQAAGEGWLAVPAWFAAETKAAAKSPQFPKTLDRGTKQLLGAFFDRQTTIMQMYIDKVFIHPDDPSVRPEPGGLSHFSNFGLSKKDEGLVVDGRIQTLADACRQIADRLADDDADAKGLQGMANVIALGSARTLTGRYGAKSARSGCSTRGPYKKKVTKRQWDALAAKAKYGSDQEAAAALGVRLSTFQQILSRAKVNAKSSGLSEDDVRQSVRAQKLPEDRRGREIVEQDLRKPASS